MAAAVPFRLIRGKATEELEPSVDDVTSPAFFEESTEVTAPSSSSP